MQYIATGLVFGHDSGHAFLGPIECGNRGDLNRREGAVVVIALDLGECGDQVFVANHKADPPAGHVVAFGHREKLHRHVTRARHLHDRWRRPAVEGDVGIGQIVNHQDVVGFGESDDACEKIELDTHRGGVRGEAQNEHLWLRVRLANGTFGLLEKIHALGHPHVFDLRACNHRAINMNRVAGVGYEHGVATIQGSEHQVRQAFLGTDGNNGFRIRVKLHIEAALVPIGDRFP